MQNDFLVFLNLESLAEKNKILVIPGENLLIKNYIRIINFKRVPGAVFSLRA